MKARHILICLALSLWGTGLQALAQDLPQVFSPNAAELGKYGKVPVSYFNGLPNISIPLTELRAKNYTLPIYLTYHAGGNKPDQHPGWVGLGWTLHAGGCINRIVNGEIDEMGKWESTSIGPNPFRYLKGYYYRADSIQNTVFDSTLMETIANSQIYEDYDPDEFQVNFEGLSSSFFLVGKNKAQIRSKEAVDYTVRIDTSTSKTVPIFDQILQMNSITADQYTYINRITLTDTQGVVYVFGGDDTAIEFSYSLQSRISPGQEGMRKALKRNANSWHITSIRFPSGEEIRFEYKKDGVPLIVTDQDYTEYSSLYYSPNGLSTEGYWYSTQNESAGNMHFTLISPSYLSRIRSSQGGDDIWFFHSPTHELTPTFDDVELWDRLVYHASGLTLDAVHENNQYQKLHLILSKSSQVDLYYTNSTQERLKLNSLVIRKGKYMDDDARYSFTYNSLRLPAYNSKQTDMWGYYSRNVDKDETEKYYLPDEQSMQAEMLTSIQYPTGGRTNFVYEAHRHGKVAEQYPFTLVQESGMTGGIRIRSMTDEDNGKTEVREFEYTDTLGGSSGILAGKPILRSEGVTRFRSYGLRYDFLFWTITLPPGEPQEGEYVFDGEMPMNQMSLTEGAHVTYSRVTEVFSDGSRIVYNYSNHELFPDAECLEMYSNYDGEDVDNPLISRELSRGLLLRKEYRSEKPGHPIVQLEENEFETDSTRFLYRVKVSTHCANSLRRKTFLKDFSYYPALKRKIRTVYSEGGATFQADTVKYFYDTHRRLKKTQRSTGADIETDTYTYTGDYSLEPYVGMTSRNMIAFPVEHIQMRKESESQEKVVAAELTAWSAFGAYYFPSSRFQASLGSGVPVSAGGTSAFSPFDGTNRDHRYGQTPEYTYNQYDIWGNLILSENRSGQQTKYYWTTNPTHLSAVFIGSKNGGEDQESDSKFFYMDFESAYQAPVGFMEGKGHYGIYMIEDFTPSLGEEYIVDWMEKQESGKWEYRSKRQQPTDVFSAGIPGKYIDQIRVYPIDTKVESYTWDPYGNLSSRTDSRGITEFYRYDGLGRLTGVYDNDGNKIEGYQYNYQNR